MGDPKKIRSKYQTPVHPWQKERLEQEKSLVQQYGLSKKTEVYKADSQLKKFKRIAKNLVSKPGEQAVKEKQQLFTKLKSLNLLQEESLDMVLGLKLEQLLERRLQTVLVRKGLARTISQARQMIVHRHVIVNGKMITSPSYLVSVEEEQNISFYAGSKFSDEEHPERKQPETVKDKEVEKESKSKKSDDKKPVAEAKKAEEKPAKEEAKEEKPVKKESDDKKVEEPKAEEKPQKEAAEKKEEPKEEVKEK